MKRKEKRITIMDLTKKQRIQKIEGKTLSDLCFVACFQNLHTGAWQVPWGGIWGPGEVRGRFEGNCDKK